MATRLDLIPRAFQVVNTWEGQIARVSPAPVPPPPPGISGLITQVEFWDGAGWVTSPPQVTAGTTIGVKTTFQNNSDNVLTYSLDTIFIYPDGTEDKRFGFLIDLLPGASGQQLEQIPASMEGEWRARLELWADYPFIEEI